MGTYEDLLAYKNYIEDNLERIESGGWAPVCFGEFKPHPHPDYRERYLKLLEERSGMKAKNKALLAALEAVTDPLHQCEQCDDHYGMTAFCTPWAQVRAALRKAKNLQSEEAWDEWCLSRWKAKEGE